MRLFIITVLFFYGFRVHAGEIIRLTRHNLALLPHGKEVDGMPGDWLIRNDKLVAVVGAAVWDREANQMVSSIQGAVIDLTTRAADNDQLVVYYPQGARVDVRSADTIVVLAAHGASVQLKAIRYATAAEPYTAETIYTLRDGETALQVVTEYCNTSGSAIRIGLSDKLRCDNDLESVAPAGEGRLAFIDNKWFHAAYGVARVDGPLYTSGKVDKANLILLGYFIHYAQADSVELAAGATLSLTRYLLTGPDIASLQRRVAAISDHRYRPLTVVTGRRGAFVQATDPHGALVSGVMADSTGKGTMLLDDGNYTVTATAPGHDTVQRAISGLAADSTLQLRLAPLTAVNIRVTGVGGEALPVKVEFRGIDGTPDAYLGPQKRSSGAGNVWYSGGGDFDVPLPPGSYRVIFSHGPEYEAVDKTLVIGRGQHPVLSVVLSRAYSTPHWIIGDLHNHSTRSGDSNADVDGRIVNAAAAGIEFAPATEHNRISDYTPEIRRLGLSRYIASAAGIELSGRPGPGDINHETAFPLRVRDSAYGYGSPHTDRNPYVQMKRLYDYDNGAFKMMQHNHPNIGWLYFDRDRDGVIDSGFGSARITDVLEVREAMLDFPAIIAGKRTSSRLLPWLQMLNLGYRIYGVANSDNHVIGPQTGGMFNFIRAGKDAPSTLDAAAIAREVKKGHVVMSNGPFLDVRVNNALPGDEIIAPGGKVLLDLTVETANWCRVNTVQVLVNGRAEPTLRWTVEANAQLFAAGPRNFHHSVALTLPADAHLIVVAYGENENVGMVNGGKLGKNIPMAMANPVFVDVDGKGFRPNGDLLGFPVPDGKARAAATED
jgi:hypothetical protein